MANYYILDQDIMFGCGGPSIDDLPNDLETDQYFEGKKIPATGELTATYGVNRDDDEHVHPDFISMPMPLFSTRLKEIFESERIDHIDFRKVVVTDPITNTVDCEYWAANVLLRISCIDTVDGEPVEDPEEMDLIFSGFTIDEKKVRGARVFRADELPEKILIDERLMKLIEEAELDGVQLRLTTEFDGD